MMRVVHRDEVEVRYWRRIERGFDGGESGARDRSGRQAHVAVRVVRMVELKVGPRECATLLAGRVLYRRVGLQRHLELEPVPEDRRDLPHLVTLHRFSLD